MERVRRLDNLYIDEKKNRNERQNQNNDIEWVRETVSEQEVSIHRPNDTRYRIELLIRYLEIDSNKIEY